MAWDALNAPADLVEGYAISVGLDRSTGAFDGQVLTSERQAAARGLLARRLLDPRGGGLGQFVAAYGARTALLDAIQANADLAAELADLAALALVTVVARSRANSGRDYLMDVAERAERELATGVRAFGQAAALALGQRPTSGGLGGGALASTYDTYTYP